jgi:mannose-6-phosphate isomerase-like protein (cupin superfamily)
MDVNKIVKKLEKEYPGKLVIAIPHDKPTEIICEVEPAKDHPDFSVAVAVIKSSTPHFNDETEEYEVLEGTLLLEVDGARRELKKGETYTIMPGEVHSASSDEAWVKVTTRPGWTENGHHLV